MVTIQIVNCNKCGVKLTINQALVLDNKFWCPKHFAEETQRRKRALEEAAKAKVLKQINRK